MKKLAIFSLIMFLVTLISVNALWKVESSFDLVPTQTNPNGITSNSTSTTAGDIWTTDLVDKLVIHYRPDGTYVDNFSVSNLGSGFPTAIWTNDTSGNADNTSNLFIITSSDDFIFITNQSGNLRGNFSLNLDAGFISAGLTSNNTVGDVTDAFILDQDGRKLHNLKLRGGENTSCSVASYASGDPVGIATNATNSRTDFFYIGDNINDEIYRITNSCVLLETIDIGALGIAGISGLEVFNRGTTINKLLVLDTGDNRVYTLSQIRSPGTFTQQSHNQTPIFSLREVNLSVNISTDGPSAFATLATNESGAMKNITDGRYGSPLTLRGITTGGEFIHFIWVNEMFTYSGFNQTVGWQITFNDTLGNTNQTPILPINFTVMVLTEGSGIRSTSRINRLGFPNISISFNRTNVTDLSFTLPGIVFNDTFADCSYEAKFAKRTQVVNATRTNASIRVETCNVTLFSARINTTGTFDIRTSIAFTIFKPGGLPGTVAAVVMIFLIVVYEIRRTFKR